MRLNILTISLGTSSFCECSAQRRNLSFAVNSILPCFSACATTVQYFASHLPLCSLNVYGVTRECFSFACSYTVYRRENGLPACVRRMRFGDTSINRRLYSDLIYKSKKVSALIGCLFGICDSGAKLPGQCFSKFLCHSQVWQSTNEEEKARDIMT